jgi:hypothetical protein
MDQPFYQKNSQDDEKDSDANVKNMNKLALHLPSSGTLMIKATAFLLTSLAEKWSPVYDKGHTFIPALFPFGTCTLAQSVHLHYNGTASCPGVVR